jgi:nucleoside-diphosphate-sugar epimerase
MTQSDAPATQIGILGHGYVGTATARALLRLGRDSGDRIALSIGYRGTLPAAAAEAELAGVEWLPLNLNDDTLVSSMGKCKVLLVTFPMRAADSDNTFAAEQLFKQLMQLTHLNDTGVSVCLLSSTSGYSQSEGVITEDSTWICDESRFGFEERLRLDGRATVIPLVGLFGGKRDPRQWLLKGMIKDLSRSVNLISHDDAGLCVAKILRNPPQGQRINVGPGLCSRWMDIARDCDILAVLPNVQDAGKEPSSPESPLRLVSNERLLGRYPELRHYSFATVAGCYSGGL